MLCIAQTLLYRVVLIWIQLIERSSHTKKPKESFGDFEVNSSKCMDVTVQICLLKSVVQTTKPFFINFLNIYLIFLDWPGCIRKKKLFMTVILKKPFKTKFSKCSK